MLKRLVPNRSSTQEISSIRESGLFHFEYYASVAKQFFADDAEAIRHYLDNASSKRLDPHPLFSTSYYLDRYPDIADAGVNPLQHYVTPVSYTHLTLPTTPYV